MIKLSDNIKNYISSLLNEEDANKYFAFISSEPSLYIRIRRNLNQDEIILSLSDKGIIVEKINEVENVFKVLTGKEWVGKTIEFALGYYYVQSLSSMIPPLILNPKEDDKVLDLCAAPGSKTTQIAERMNNKGTLISNEPNLDRIKMLIHNIDRMNLINIGVIQNRGEWLNRFYNNSFDKILVDAPCSALGIVQKKGEISNWWSIERLSNLTKIQLMILTSAIKMVKVGGEIVYSTCTFTPEENELLINYILNKYPLEVLDIQLPIKSTEAIINYKGEKLNTEIIKARRIFPWEVNSDGFFIVKLRKVEEIKSTQSLESNEQRSILLSHNNKNISHALNMISDTFNIRKEIWQQYQFQIKGNDIFITDKDWKDNSLNLFTRIGTHFGLFDKFGKAHLHSFSAQLLGNEVKQNIYTLTNENQLKDYLTGGIIRTTSSLKNQQVIMYKDYILGTAVPTAKGLKSQYPKSKRMDHIKL